MKIIKRISALFCAAALVLWCMAGTLFAVSADQEESGSLTLWCVKDDDIVSNMHWQIYRVGYRVNNDYVFEGAFAGYRATLGDKTKPMLEWDTETVASAGEALKRKTIVDKIPVRSSGFTDSAGAVTFAGLENGLYLVWGDVLYVGDTTYIPSAIFFEINGTNAHVLNAYPKIVLRVQSGGINAHSVRKVWLNDENQPWNRAVSITVERYRDNQYYDDVILSDQNNWTYEWEDTDEHIWFVYEKIIPENYTVSYEGRYTQYLILNTYDEITTSDTTQPVTQTTAALTGISDSVTTTSGTETVTDTTGTDRTDIHTNLTNTRLTDTNSTDTVRTGTTVKTTTVQPTGTTAEKIPQTGQLWWPVPGLAMGGVLFLGLGIKLNKKDDDE